MNKAHSVVRTYTRRQALGATAAACAAPLVLPASVLGRGERPAPSDRIVMGAIGVGGRGTSDLGWLLGQPEVQFTAVCDVRRAQRDAAKRRVDEHYGNSDCAAYRDLRELFSAHDELDAVLIAIGDRWHAPAAILAMQAGLDVYCEKPGTMTVAEGRAVVETATRYGRVFQTGTQRLNEPNFIAATEWARTGKLGELKTVRAHLWPQVQDVTHNAWLPEQPAPDPEELDWDLWLGPSPWRPYNAGYLGGCGAWGTYWDLAAGVAGWGSHTFVQCQFAAGAELTSPVVYRYPGNSSGNGMVVTFANGIDMVLQFEGWSGTCGVRFEGSEGWTSIADGYSRPEVSSPALLDDYDQVIDLVRARRQRPLNHVQDFLSCVRTRENPIAHPEVMHRSMTTNHAINLCLHLKRDLRWDPDEEAFIDDDEANRMRTRPAREPWRV